ARGRHLALGRAHGLHDRRPGGGGGRDRAGRDRCADHARRRLATRLAARETDTVSTTAADEELRRQLARETLSSSWLGSRLGGGASRRRHGRPLGGRLPAPTARLYPVWQLGPDWRPLPIVPRLVRAAREAGLDELELYRLLTSTRVGLTGGRSARLADVLAET